MKTYKQMFMESENKYAQLLSRHQKLNTEYTDLINRVLDGTKVESTEVSVLKYVVEGLQDIRKQGGSYSSAKAVELLYALGKL